MKIALIKFLIIWFNNFAFWNRGFRENFWKIKFLRMIE